MGWLAFFWSWFSREAVPSTRVAPSPEITSSVVASPRITTTVTMEPVQGD